MNKGSCHFPYPIASGAARRSGRPRTAGGPIATGTPDMPPTDYAA